MVSSQQTLLPWRFPSQQPTAPRSPRHQAGGAGDERFFPRRAWGTGAA